MRCMVVLRPVVVVLASLSVAGPIHVVPASVRAGVGIEPEAATDPGQKALQHFQRGVALYQEGDFERALFEFQNAYDAAPTYRVLYNIGVTQVELHDYAGAQTSLRRYLEEGGDEISAERRSTIEGQLAKLAERVGTLIVTTVPPGAAVRVGSKVVGESPVELPVNIGPVAVEVLFEGYASASRQVAIIGGEETRVDLVLEAMGASSGSGVVPSGRTDAPVVTPTEDEVDLRVQRLLLGTWISLAFGVAFGAGATATGVFALQARNDYEDVLNEIDATQDEIDDRHDRARNLGLTTDVLVGAAAVAGVTALGLGIAAIVIRKRSREAGPSARTGHIAPTFGGFVVRF